MEGSINSHTTKAAASPQRGLSSEESGWTMYFDDFLSNDNRNSSACSFGYMGSSASSSLVSDAASCIDATLKFHDHIEPSSGSSAKSCRELSLKRRRKKGVSEDESLEDTASSPVNSPKVSDLKQLDMSPRRKEGDKEFSGEGKLVRAANR